MGHVIGIDLGTTNSAVAVVEGGKPVIIPNDKGERSTPSIVAFSNNGERLVGTLAKRQAAVNSNRTISSVKRHMGTEWNIAIDGKQYNPQEISAMILRDLRKSAEAYLGESITDAVITVPAYFNDIQRQATKDAGRIAGLNVLRIINEPTSAALAYGLDHGAAQKIMVYDLGGGTFDVSIIEIGDGVVEVLATGGDNHLGGDDFDERLVQYLINEFQRMEQIDLRKDAAAMQRVKEAAEQAKKELSVSEYTTVQLPYIAQNHNGPVHLDISISRVKFESLTKELVDRTAIPVQNALHDAGIAASELGRVLLVGGSTRIPAVQRKVKELTGKEPSHSINPDECVAQGAAIQGDVLSGGTLQLAGSSGGILLLDVTPLSLSIETVGGVATRLVERNSTLPVHYSQIFTTAAPFQTSVEIHVLQGERPMAKDNKTIGKFKLKGIKRAMDTNGILMVSAKDLGTGKEQSITITANQKMSDAEIEAAIRDAEQYAYEDQMRRDAMTVCAEAQVLLTKVEQALSAEKKQIDKAERKQIKEECNTLKKLITKTTPEKMTAYDLDSIRTAMQNLEYASAALHME